MTFDEFASNAPKVLFKLGWILGGLSFLAALVPMLWIGNGDAFVPSIFVAVVGAISAVLVPWIAAAVIWRIDQYLERLK
jgi:hypothetical protein